MAAKRSQASREFLTGIFTAGFIALFPYLLDLAVQKDGKQVAWIQTDALWGAKALALAIGFVIVFVYSRRAVCAFVRRK